MARKNDTNQTILDENKTIVTPSDSVDLDTIPNPEDLLDLEEIASPLREIKEFLNEPVIILSGEQRVSTLGSNGKDDKPGHYFILSIQSVVTGEVWRSSCSHWFMLTYVKTCMEKGIKPFPIKVRFYKDKDSIKFRGAGQPVQSEMAF